MFGFIKAATKRTVQSFSLIPAYMQHLGIAFADKFLRLVSEGYKKSSIAYACIRTLCEAVAEAPIVVYQELRDGSLKPIRNHPLLDLLRHPNPFMSEYEYWWHITTNLSICGHSFFWKERNNINKPRALWPLRPDRMSPIYGTSIKDLLLGWEYSLDGDIYFVPKEDIVHYHYSDPGGETGGLVEGYGPLQILAREIDTDNEATGFIWSMIKNYAIPGVVIRVKTPGLTLDQAELLKQKFKSKYGNIHRGEPAVVDGDSEIVPVAHTMKDMEFPDLRSVQESRVAAVLGVPAILVGLKVGLDRSTFSNVDGMREYFVDTTVSSLWRRLGDRTQTELAYDFIERPNDKIVLAFDTSNVRALQKRFTEQAKRYQDGFKDGAVTLNEYRVHGLKLDPDDNGGNFYIRSFNMIPVPFNVDPLAIREEVIDGTATIVDDDNDEKKLVPSTQRFLV